MSAEPAETESHKAFLRTLVSGCHILHFHQVLDAYGHLSARHPEQPDRFFIPRNTAPGTVSSQYDLVEYHIHDGEPVNSDAPKGYVERYIHSEIYKKFPGVMSVIHSHSTSVIPYTISSVPMQPCFHMGGFLGTSVPVFDISKHYADEDIRDLLIRNTRLGAALACCFTHGSVYSNGSGEVQEPSQPVTLMRGHGYTVCGNRIEESVLRAIYTKENAAIQTNTLLSHAAFHGASLGPPAIDYIHEDEVAASTEMTRWSFERPWNLWLKEVELAGLYTNLV
ncbi:hypothetical protein FSARC_14711 [Fusarium sarcochroum]|uniref:Class II aldolase/adducin N-terminal domain-containing protein n=1 Tax=Fusarium sarcochroum TaxID=1208366 RepID=A0A8H4SRE8_9HYPO|nr:hypothetical protein FSARC_14711 [Fusarium sarcochroum]